MAFVRFGGNIGLVGSGIQCLSSQILSKSSKNWFEKRTAGGTELEFSIENSNFFFPRPRNLLVS